jgi:hypothetical protein
MSRFTVFRAAAICAPAFFLAACGGGGGDDSGGAQATGVVITTANAKAVSADALDASVNLGAAANSGLPVGVQVDGGAGANPMRLADVARKLAGMAPTTSLVTGVAVNETLQCDSGSLNFRGNVSGGSALVAGDVLTITALNCRSISEGITMNGSMTLSVTRGPWDTSLPYPRSVTMTVTSNNFTLIENGVTSVSNGDMTIALDETSATSSVAVVTANSLANTTGLRTSTMKNYRQTATVSGSTTSIEVSGSIETNNGRLGSGTHLYAIRTIAPLTMNSSDDFTGGTLEVVGANATALRVIVTGTNSFNITVDADGNGSFESSTTATRSELESLL